MALKTNVKQPVKKVNQKQKIIVAKGRILLGTPIPYETLYTEMVPNVETAKQRVAELKEQYKDTDGLSVHYFSV